MNTRSLGFTLVELMIAVAIIGLLAAIAVPLFQERVVITQMKRAHAELSSYKSAFEASVNNGQTDVTNEDLGYERSNLVREGNVASVSSNGAGSLHITMGQGAHSAIRGTSISLQRAASGVWRCHVDTSAAGAWRSAFMPHGCE
ncbi:pilin [Stutzerimonas nosocomialis]